MNKFILPIIFVFCIHFAFSQTSKMEECPLDSDAQGVLSRYEMWASRPTKPDSQQYIFPYLRGADFYLTGIIYQRVKKGNFNVGISAVFGTDEKGDVFMIFDKNQNFDFRDDSIYHLPRVFYANKRWKSYENIPKIDIDSLKFIGTDGKKATVKTSFRALPSPDNRFLAAPTSAGRVKTGLLTVMPVKYYKATFAAADSTYEFRVTKFPLAEAFEGMIPPSEHIEQDEYCILVKRRQEGGDSVLRGVAVNLLASIYSYSDSILQLNNHYYKVYSGDYFTKSFHINELQPLTGGDMVKLAVGKRVSSHPSFNAFWVNKHKQSSYSFAGSKLTLLYFTGSWCVPCELAFNDMVAFYKQYNGKISIVAVDKEKDKASSVRYFNRKKIKWDLFYEPLDCKSGQCAGNLFSVFTYPHYFLINEKSEILSEGEGYGGLRPINDFLDSSINPKTASSLGLDFDWEF